MSIVDGPLGAVNIHGIRFDLSRSDVASLEHVKRYLHNDSINGSPATGNWTVAVHKYESKDPGRSLIQEGSKCQGRVESYKDTWLDVFVGRNGEEVFVGPPEWRSVIVKTEGAVDVHIGNGGAESDRHVLRCVREIVYRSIENCGGQALHAACVSVDGEGGLIVGGAGAGKTSLMLQIVDLCDAEYVANDRVLVFENGNKSYIAGYLPLAIRAGVGTCNSWRRFRESVESGFRPRRTRIVQDASGVIDLQGTRYPIDAKIELEPLELRESLKVACVPRTSLSWIVFPVISSESSAVDIRSLDASAAANRIMEHSVTGRDPLWPSPWLQRTNGTKMKGDAALLRSLASEVPAYEIRFGHDWTAAVDALRSVIPQ